jgi:hypothetical protein
MHAQAYYRAARAALRLGELLLCQELCTKGRKLVGPSTQEFDALEKVIAGIELRDFLLCTIDNNSDAQSSDADEVAFINVQLVLHYA